MAPRGDFQAVFDLVVVYEGGDVESGNRLEYGRGDRIPAKVLGDAQRDRYLELGAIRPFDESTPLPGSNDAAAPPTLTQPDGSPVELAPDEEIGSGFKPARSHAEADAMASDAGVTFPSGTKLDAKNEALAQVFAARATGDTTPPATDENIAELSDAELIQRGVDFGHDEDEMTEMSHDELVLFVAEAMARAGSTTAQQDAAVAEREANELQTPAPSSE